MGAFFLHIIGYASSDIFGGYSDLPSFVQLNWWDLPPTHFELYESHSHFKCTWISFPMEPPPRPGHALVLIASAAAAARWSGDGGQGGIAGRFASRPDHQEVVVTSGYPNVAGNSSTNGDVRMENSEIMENQGGELGLPNLYV